jgi:hypothetical protein
MLATALVVGASGLTANFWLLIALRLAAGATGAVAFVTGGSLAAAAAGGGPSRAPIVLAFITAAAAGIAMAGISTEIAQEAPCRARRPASRRKRITAAKGFKAQRASRRRA